MPVSPSKIFEELSSFIKAQYPTAREIRMPYCRLWTDPVTKEAKYRVQLFFRKRSGDWLESEALAEVDPERTGILLFKEGYHWENWI